MKRAKGSLCSMPDWVEAKDLRLRDWLIPVGRMTRQQARRLPIDIWILYGALGRIERDRAADLKDDFSTDEVCAGIDALQRRLDTSKMLRVDVAHLSQADLNARVDNVGQLLSTMKYQPDHGGLTRNEHHLHGTQRNGTTPIVNGTMATSGEVDEGGRTTWHAWGDYYDPGPCEASDATWSHGLVYVSISISALQFPKTFTTESEGVATTPTQVFRRMIVLLYDRDFHPLTRLAWLQNIDPRAEPTFAEMINHARRGVRGDLTACECYEPYATEWSDASDEGECRVLASIRGETLISDW